MACEKEKQKVADLEAEVADLKGQVEDATGAAKQGFARLLKKAQDELVKAKQAACKIVVVHFKSLIAINAAINGFINTQFAAMQALFAGGNLIVSRGTTEDLSGNATSQLLQNLDVGGCPLADKPTQEQTDLFANRKNPLVLNKNVGRDDLVVYIVTTLTGTDAKGNPIVNLIGCATHPKGQPGVAVVQNGAQWLVSHEVAHVLGLRHVCEMPACVAGQSDNLMFPSAGWTNVPPDLSAAEFRTMKTSPFAKLF
jgi:hypothetical protein